MGAYDSLPRELGESDDEVEEGVGERDDADAVREIVKWAVGNSSPEGLKALAEELAEACDDGEEEFATDAHKPTCGRHRRPSAPGDGTEDASLCYSGP